MTTGLVVSVTDELVAELEALATDASDLTPDSDAQEYLGCLATRLLAERAELLRDAERYRHYRQGMVSPELLDSNIDAAMQSEAKP